ncbi:MAG: flagellar biosynthesis protein FlhB [Bdellovibrio sp.]|nr:MAG: flagellar biosynthesis protein FlhB [Bdellovibrio sp.]
MAETDHGEKTEEPTQQRREDFRKRGQVAQTKELASLFVVLVASLMIWALGHFFLKQLYEVFTHSFGDFVLLASRDSSWISPAQYAMKKAALIIFPVGGILWLFSIISSVVQVGFIVNEEALQLKPERLDPVQGFKRVFSLRSAVEGLKALVKVVIVGFIVLLVLKSEWSSVPYLISYTAPQAMSFMGDLTLKLLGSVGVFLLVLSGLDFLYQRWDLEQKMKMTKQELKEEHKSREGDPLIKARIRRVQREMAQRRMMEDVPKADVVITNPTHIAVALQYTEKMIAPKIVAMGAGLIAQKIREIAEKHKIPIVENKPLARTMYKTLKVGQTIPRELYTAVAEVLSYIFRMRKKRKGNK